MFENLAWNNFLKTGNIETYIEYKKMKEINENNLDVGDNYSELDKSEGDSNKRNNL